MKILKIFLTLLFIYTQQQLWFSNQSIPTYIAKKQTLLAQIHRYNDQLETNTHLKEKIKTLKRTDNFIIEEQARLRFNMIKKGESFFRFTL